MYPEHASTRASTVSRALARDRVGFLAVLAFILAPIAPITVRTGIIPTAYAVTGLTGIPFAVIAVAAVLALFAPGISRRRGGSFSDLRAEKEHTDPLVLQELSGVYRDTALPHAPGPEGLRGGQ